jgi:hypothetical protein
MCGKEFVSEPGIRADDAILKMRAEFKEHSCKDVAGNIKSRRKGGSRWVL